MVVSGLLDAARKVVFMSGSDENFTNCGRNDAPVLLPAPALVAPGVLPVTDALMAKRQIGLRRWVVDAEMARDVDEEFSPDKVDLAGEIIYQSVRMVALHQFNFDPVMCATYVGLHKSRLMLSHVVDPNEGQAVSWHDEQMAKLNKGERAISLLCYARKFGIAVWSIYSRQESRRIYFVMLTSELEYEYSNNFPVEESVEQKQMSRKPSERSSDLLASFVEQIASGNMKEQEQERERERERERVEATTTESPEATESPPTEDPTQEQGALPNGEQVTPKPSESSPPPLKEPTNDLLEATEALNKRRRDAGRIVMAGGACPIKGTLFLFPARNARKEAAPPASDVVAPASNEEV
ncbi:MAG: hypothetical protein HN940_00480 [Planctomycetes bacterium]|nr:hypothetical protein [Planctomycetota bacterium]